MARLGPWDGARRVAVAVSGGADSLALALLAQGWGDPVAFIVDHGLRASSAAEAGGTRDALEARGIPATVMRLDGLAPGPGLAARARSARYAALSAACRAAALVDLLVGHHGADQAETVLMRHRRGSGPDGLAGMAALVEQESVRVLRPLLGIDPLALRTLVLDAGLTPVDDPTNADLRTTRAQVRQEIGGAWHGSAADAAAAGTLRAAGESAVAEELAARVRLYPEGFAVLSPGPIGARSLAALLRSLSGRRLPVAGVASLAACPRPATIAGVRIQPAGRLGPGWLLTRETAAVEPPAAARPGTVWDGRFRVMAAPDGATIGALGLAARGLLRRSDWPSAVLATLPAIRRHAMLSDVPHLDYDGQRDPAERGVLRPANLPAAGAPFLPACGEAGVCSDACHPMLGAETAPVGRGLGDNAGLAQSGARSEWDGQGN